MQTLPSPTPVLPGDLAAPDLATLESADTGGTLPGELPHPPYRWPLFALSIGAFGLGLTEFVMLGLLPQVAASLKISIPRAGDVVAAYALGVVIGAPLLTLLTRTLAPKVVLAGLMGLFTLSNLLTAVSPGFDTVFASRLLSGLPHGAFFGLGAVLATRLAPPGRQAQAMATMFAGLTIANVVGVPLGTLVGQHLSWRVTFLLVAVVGVLATLALLRWVPRLPARPQGSVKDELAAFAQPAIWLLLITAVIGVSGLFAVFSYVAPLMTEAAHLSSGAVPLVLILAGVGFTVGNALGGRLADWSPLKSIYLMLGAMTVVFVLLALSAHVAPLAVLLVFLFSVFAFALINPVQLLLMRTAAGAESLGAASSQSAFNMGNAVGAYLGALPIAAGLGYASVAWVGAALSLAGLLMAGVVGQYLGLSSNPLARFRR
ncbi:MFS transporter [Deinococcus sp. UYEF24]